ncbi:MAG: hypothetical protein WBE34_02520 [Candidatus Nitrosopolaris sp.]
MLPILASCVIVLGIMACSIGRTDKANHQYDLTDFWAASQGGNMSAISYLKAPAYQNGHPA